MTTRPKLELQINTPTEVELLFPDPITGKSAFGSYYLYCVSVDGKEYSFFPPEDVHDQLKLLKKGDKATITKLAAQRGSKLITAYDVQVINKPVPVIADKKEDRIEEDSTPVMRPDNFYSIMLQSYKDALSIQRELNGFGDSEKIAVTLFIARTKANNY